MQKQPEGETNPDCAFCGEGNGNLTIMMGEALQAKHAISQSEGFLGYVDVLMKLEDPCTSEEAWAANQFKELNCRDE